MSSIFDKVKGIVVKNLGVDESSVNENSSFVEDLGADSLDQVELVMAFEEEFGVEISDSVAEKITTIRKAVDYIEQNSKSS
ncbi:MAG: acyl carrier protein [Rickettsiales bacterium]|jgi:acyl carrier protein|nr:acyl carrier protein [Rickettsiales bacterium]